MSGGGALKAHQATRPRGQQARYWDVAEIRRRVSELGPWFQNINLRGVRTAPDHFLNDYPAWKWGRFAHALPQDLNGRTVLDIGCNAGFYAIEMKRRGAERVVAVDSDRRYLAQGRFAAEVLELDIEFEQLSVYDVAKLGERFDIVLFMGVFYHLRHPLLALDLIYEYVAGDYLVFQSMLRGPECVLPVVEDRPFWDKSIFYYQGFPQLNFIEHSYAGDPTNWWIPNRACVEGMIGSSGFDIVEQPEEEVFICRRGERPAAVDASYVVHPAQRS